MATNSNKSAKSAGSSRSTHAAKPSHTNGPEYIVRPERQRSGHSNQQQMTDRAQHSSRAAVYGASHNTSHTSRPSRHHKKVRISKRKVLRFVFFIVFCVSAGMLVSMLLDYRKSRSEYDEISALAISESEAQADAEFEAEAPSDGDAVLAVSTPRVISGSLPWEQQERIAEEVGITVDWDALQDINRYVAAWLYCPDTNISYPVVQYKDNEYFLNRNFNRREDESGALFFDYRNILSEGRENWIIYGHRRNDKSMFGSLAKYAKPEYLAEHPVMYLLMPDRSYRMEIFSCRTVHAEQRYFQLWFNSNEEYASYLDKAVDQSYWTPSVQPDTDTPILTLATCSTYVGDDEPRLLVHGRLIPIE